MPARKSVHFCRLHRRPRTACILHQHGEGRRLRSCHRHHRWITQSTRREIRLNALSENIYICGVCRLPQHWRVLIANMLWEMQGPVAAGTNPTYAAYDSTRGCAYFTNENLEDGCIKAFSLSTDGKLAPINSQPVVGNHPCYLSVEPGTRSLLTASYVSGHVHCFPTEADGSLKPGSSDSLPTHGNCTPAAPACRTQPTRCTCQPASRTHNAVQLRTITTTDVHRVS